MHALHGKCHIWVFGRILHAPQPVNRAQCVDPPPYRGCLMGLGQGINMRGDTNRWCRQGMNVLICAPLPLDNSEDREIGLAGWVAHKMKAGQHINKLPAGGLRGEAFWNKVYSKTHFERYRKRSLNQLSKALKEQNNDYRV